MFPKTSTTTQDLQLIINLYNFCIKYDVNIEIFLSSIHILKFLKSKFESLNDLICFTSLNICYKFIDGYDNDEFDIIDFIRYNKFKFTHIQYIKMEIEILKLLDYKIFNHVNLFISDDFFNSLSKEKNIFFNLLDLISFTLNISHESLLLDNKYNKYLKKQSKQLEYS